MALLIGIKNGIDKGFTQEELDFTNGFALGVLCMTARVGAVIPTYSPPKNWTATDFLHRIRMTNQITGCFGFYKDDVHIPLLPNWFDLAFVERMHEAGWSCNVNFESNAKWKNTMKRRLLEDAERDMKYALKHHDEEEEE